MKNIFKTLVLLSVLTAIAVPAVAQDYGAALSGGGNGGAIALRLDGGTLNYQIFLDGGANGASVGGTDLNAAFNNGYAAGSVPFTGDLDGAQVTSRGPQLAARSSRPPPATVVAAAAVAAAVAAPTSPSTPVTPASASRAPRPSA